VRAVEEGLLADLRQIVGFGHVLSDPDLVASYEADWTGRFCGRAAAVVRPATTVEVAAVVARCRQAGAPLTLQGGNTGLVGGGVPLVADLVLSLRRLDTVSEATGDGQLSAGAGVTVAGLEAAARRAGWSYGVDLASRDSATVGGTVATNAGGLRVLRDGDTRAQLLGIEAVLGTGELVSHLGGLTKDNTGYDLAGLLCGSEGTLGVVTAARLRLRPQADERVAALVAFDAVDSAVRAAGALRRSLPSLAAAELFLAAGLELVCAAEGLAPPFADPHPAYLLVEAADRRDPSEALGEAIGSLASVADVAVAVEPARVAALWRYREGHTEAINRLGAPHKLDVALPADVLAEFVADVGAVVRAVAPDAAVWLFGHAADGNLHVNVTGLAPDDDRVDDAVLRLCAARGGSISAEHGIGAAKRRWLSLNRSPAELATFSALKRALDPDGILNPGVLLPDS
jgi:FAD/FMN-containing dehydrogenase